MCLKILFQKNFFYLCLNILGFLPSFFVVTQVIGPISKSTYFLCTLLQIFISIGSKIMDLGQVVVALLRGKNYVLATWPKI